MASLTDLPTAPVPILFLKADANASHNLAGSQGSRSHVNVSSVCVYCGCGEIGRRSRFLSTEIQALTRPNDRIGNSEQS